MNMGVYHGFEKNEPQLGMGIATKKCIAIYCDKQGRIPIRITIYCDSVK